MMNKGTQPKRRGRPRKIQQPAPEETVRPAEETEGVPEKKKKPREVESEGSSRAGQDDESGGSQSEDRSGEADKVWPVLINGQTVWVELDNKPSPEVRPADIKMEIFYHFILQVMFLKKELANTEKLLAQKMHRNQSLEKQNLSLEQQNQILEQENKRLKQVLEKIKMQVKEV